MAKQLADARSKIYIVPIRSINANTNPRQALSEALDGLGWTVFVGDKTLWPLATSDNAEERAEYVRLLQEHDPDLVAMAATMLTQGQLQPVEVREGGSTTGNHKYTLVFGCRRCLAILYNWCTLGKPKEPVVNAAMVKGNETSLIQRAIVENIRKQPSPLEESQTIRMLINNGQSKEEVAMELGWSLATVNNRLKLLELPEKVQAEIKAGKKTVTKALAESNGKHVGGDKEDTDGGDGPATATEPRAKLRALKEVLAAAEEYRPGTPQRAVFDWLLGKREKIG